VPFSVWAGVVASADEIGGQYCENCHIGKIVPESVQITGVSEGCVDMLSTKIVLRRFGRKVKNWSESRSSDSVFYAGSSNSGTDCC
jgi:hypothetical protein